MPSIRTWWRWCFRPHWLAKKKCEYADFLLKEKIENHNTFIALQNSFQKPKKELLIDEKITFFHPKLASSELWLLNMFRSEPNTIISLVWHTHHPSGPFGACIDPFKCKFCLETVHAMFLWELYQNGWLFMKNTIFQSPTKTLNDVILVHILETMNYLLSYSLTFLFFMTKTETFFLFCNNNQVHPSMIIAYELYSEIKTVRKFYREALPKNITNHSLIN